MAGPPLVLIGPMASGKTRTGRRLALGLGEQFRDTDQIVEAHYGPIPTIFETEGEPAFRHHEREAVQQALAEGGVIAFGGGAVLDPDTQSDLAECAVVYLITNTDAAAERLAKNHRRPLVEQGGIERWAEIYEQRRSLYEQLGKIHIDTSRRPMAVIADELVAWYRSRYGDEL